MQNGHVSAELIDVRLQDVKPSPSTPQDERDVTVTYEFNDESEQ